MAYMPKTISLVAEHGITFANSFVNLPLCAPSRASFLTGQSAHNHQIMSNKTNKGGGWEKLKDHEANMLPVWLQEAGYDTALLGKYINGYGKDEQSQARRGSWLQLISRWTSFGSPQASIPPGWNLWYASISESYYGGTINENGKILTLGQEPSDYATDILKNRAVRFIDDQEGDTEPFFMLIATKAPHGQGEKGVKGPAIPSPTYQNKFMDVKLPKQPAHNEQAATNNVSIVNRGAKWQRGDEKAYRAALQSLQSVDDLVEAVVDALRDARKLDNTVIIYTSDNGFIYGNPGREGKNSPYEGSIRVPLLVRGPGIPENAMRNQLVNNLDVVATIIELAGAKPGRTLDGRSLVPLFTDANIPWRSAILIDGKGAVAVRTPSRKYIRHKNGSEELYDLVTDPQELENKAGSSSYAGDLAALRRVHDSLTSCTGASCWSP
jgi:arylsulfatase A-like enzyme